MSQSDLLISEYVEDGATKCIEIFNPTNSSISLDNIYRLRIGYDGQGLTTLRNLTGTISSKGTLVICRSGSSYSSPLVFVAGPTGNDAIVLEKNMSSIDVIGNVGCDPGVAWNSSGLSTANMTLVRKPCITDGVSSDPSNPPCTFPTLASEWVGFPAGDLSHLGSHSFLFGSLNITESTPTLCGASDGRIEIEAEGAGLEYSINGLSGPYQSTNIFTGLIAGDYDVAVRVTDDPDCSVEDQVTLSEGPSPAIVDVKVFDPTDCGLSDGKIEITAMGSHLEYSIDNGTSFQNGSTFSNLAPGSYDVLVQVNGNSSCVDQSSTAIASLADPVINSIDPSPTTDCGRDDGTITIDANSSGLEYSIDQGVNWQSSKTFSGLSAGMYDIIARKSNAPSCRDEESTNITSPALPQVVVDAIGNANCRGFANGSISITASGGSGNFNYEWTGPSSIGNTAQASDLSAGNYTVTVSDATSPGCQVSISGIRVDEPSDDPPIPTLGVFPDLCELDNPVPLSPNPSGIIGSWSGDGVSNNQFDPQNLLGTILLTFTPDPDICAQIATTNMEVISAQTPNLTPIASLCEDEPTIVLDDITDGISGNWTGPGVSNNRFDPEGLSGIVQLTFQVDPGQCAHNANISFEVYGLKTPQLDPFLPVCENGASITLPTLQDQILGGWSGAGVKNNITFDPTGLTGSVQLTFTPLANQCALPAAQNLLIAHGPNLDFIIEDPSCYGEFTGTAEVLIDGGQGTIAIDWSNDGTGDFDDSEKITSLGDGQYSIQVRDQSGCIVMDEISLEEPEALSIRFDTSPESQAGASDGSSNANVKGGTKPYVYRWSNGANRASLSNLAPGNYTVTVTDDQGCEVVSATTVTEGSCNLTAQIFHQNISCYGANDGWAEIMTLGGVAPFSYQWSHLPNYDSSYVGALNIGSYQVTVTDAGGCEIAMLYEITQPDSLISHLSVTPETSPGANDVSIVVNTTGGFSPYQWNWNTGDSGNVLSNLRPGRYWVTTTDANGCQNLLDTIVTGLNCNMSLTAMPSHLQCENATDGAISVVAVGGDPDYQYIWSHDSTLHEETAGGLAAGQYSISVEDAQGCLASTTTTIEAPSPMQVTFDKDPPTASLSNGVIRSEVSGGTAPYQWTWSTGSMTKDISNLREGIYYLTLNDANGCETIDSILLVKSSCDLTLSVATDSVSCFGQNDGVAKINVRGASGKLTITWSSDSNFKETEASGLSAGKYAVTVTDETGCEKIEEFTIGEPELLRIAFDAENETAVGAKDGFIVVTTFGGTSPFTYQWNTGQTTDSIGRLKPGTYVISVTDSRGCQTSRSTMINAADCTLLSNVSTRPVACYGESTGAARLDITTLDFPVDIQWSHDSLLTKNVSENLAAGIYSVTITDQASCRHSWTYEIEQPDSLNYTTEVFHQSEAGVNDGSIHVNVNGGAPPYSIFWDNAQTGTEISDLAPGSYFFTVVDDNGCTIQDSVMIFPSDKCQLAVNIFSKPSGCQSNTGSIRVEPINYRGALAFKWSVSDISPASELNNLMAGTYWIEVSDDLCTVRDTVQIGINEITSLSYNLKQSICDPESNSLQLGAVAGGMGLYTFRLDNEIIDKNTILAVSPGSHILRVNDAEGCSFSDTFMLVENNSIFITPDTTVKLGEELELVADIVGDLTKANFGWRNREGSLCEQCKTFNTFPEESGTYTFYIRDQNGCEVEKKVTVTVTEQNLYFIPNVYTINNDGLNDEFIVYDGKNLIDEIVVLEIFDRRGVKIYETNNLASNQEAPNFQQIMVKAIAPQIYIYRADIRFKRGRRRIVHGDFLLLR